MGTSGKKINSNTVCLINNYPMDLMYQYWKKGSGPGQHVWGATHLHEYAYQTLILPHMKYKLVNSLGQKLHLGDFLDQQIRALLASRQFDLLYSACQWNTQFLSLTRTLKLFRKPLIMLVHHPIELTKKTKLLLSGHDKILFLSNSILEEVKDSFDLPESKVASIEWGVDLEFYANAAQESLSQMPEFVLSVGKTFRDFDTLVEAFKGIHYPLRIVCTGQSAPTTSALPTNVEVDFSDDVKIAIPPPQLLDIYSRSMAVAIPLIDTPYLAGLTSLLEAMAMGKPVVMTKNRGIDIDIEREGIGFWVEPGDLVGWQKAVNYLLNNPGEVKKMGKRSFELCRDRYNIRNFTSQLAKIFDSLVKN